MSTGYVPSLLPSLSSSSLLLPPFFFYFRSFTLTFLYSVILLLYHSILPPFTPFIYIYILNERRNGSRRGVKSETRTAGVEVISSNGPLSFLSPGFFSLVIWLGPLYAVVGSYPSTNDLLSPNLSCFLYLVYYIKSSLFNDESPSVSVSHLLVKKNQSPAPLEDFTYLISV